ncbi:MAG: acyltransferase [Proteobacteria bacterium]|nr:acyltransferase [Pseudomonadota bacterium]MBU1060646.1 acyltransferase [Pseudomonadota bacterium]
MAQRTDWVDYAKGLGIILVVYAHLLSSGFHAHLPIQEHFFFLSDSIVYSFHMPLFFFLAGLFAEKSYKKRGARNFLVNKVKFIVYPYLLWSFLQASIELVFANQSHRGVQLADIMAIPYLPFSQFWFLYALVLMFLSYALLSQFARFAPLAMITVAGVLFFCPINTEILALHGFSTGFIFFVSALLAKEYLGNFAKNSIQTGSTCVLFFLLIGSGWYIFERAIEPTRLTDGSHPLYFLYLAGLGISFCIGLAQYLAEKKYCSVVKVFGTYSLQIYLVHMLAGVAVRIVLLNFFSIENPFLHMVIGVSAGLLVPIGLYKITLKFNFPYLFEMRQKIH